MAKINNSKNVTCFQWSQVNGSGRVNCKLLFWNKMAERGEVSELSRTTARGFVKQNPYPKYKYIEDPADVVSTTYKEQFSQFNVEYHELLLAVSPMFGRFSGERVVFLYDWDKVTVMVENNLAYVMFLRPGTSPIEFERFCLHFVYSRNAQMILRWDKYSLDVVSWITELGPFDSPQRTRRTNLNRFPLFQRNLDLPPFILFSPFILPLVNFYFKFKRCKLIFSCCLHRIGRI